MRVTTQQQYLNSIDNMQTSQTKLAKLQNQIDTGKRIDKPSDDPVAAAQVVKLERELAQYEKYQLNITVTQRRLELQETVLDDVRIQMNRVKELTLQGANGTLTDQDRKTIAAEINETVDHIASLMNTKDAQGEYIFAGNTGKIQPYQQQTDGSYSYKGDEGQRMIQVSPELIVPSNDSGRYLFESVTGSPVTTIKGAYAAQPGPPTPVVSNVTYPTTADENSFLEKTSQFGDLTVNVLPAAGPGPFTYEVRDSAGNIVQDENGANITGAVPATAVNVHGMRFDVATPANPVNFAGERSLVLSTEPEKKNILNIAQDLAKDLEKPITNQTERDALKASVNKYLDQWDEAAERNNESITRVGSRLASLKNVSEANLDFKLFTETSLSSLRDTNMPEAISKFSLEEATLQASQLTFGRVSALSLFNHIN